jgi:hypothetical protein
LKKPFVVPKRVICIERNCGKAGQIGDHFSVQPFLSLGFHYIYPVNICEPHCFWKDRVKFHG